MTLTFNFDLNSVKVNQHVIYLSQRSFGRKSIVRTQTDIGSIALPGLLKWPETVNLLR